MAMIWTRPKRKLTECKQPDRKQQKLTIYTRKLYSKKQIRTLLYTVTMSIITHKYMLEKKKEPNVQNLGTLIKKNKLLYRMTMNN